MRFSGRVFHFRDTGIKLERTENRGREGNRTEKWEENVENKLEMDGKFEIHPKMSVIPG